ncbi:LADA_0C03840g1_1 [Lachancea dasiensis]|uniref:LADA_0C03840g1_1 n=1 Tax=Lachancea dasiensis TaxID=1072105 RepID=A0A1G4IYK8_9SACH|nr:LADA_0C03840g1_1 [Lachancea dasiensis]
MDFVNERSVTPDYSGLPAKEYTLDIPRVPSVELPLKLSGSHDSVTKAIEMCGGIDNVKKALNAHKDTQEGLELYLNDDRNSDGPSAFFNEHPIVGRLAPHRDESIVMKLSLPKGTLEANGGDLRKAIASVPANRAKIVPVGIVNSTVRFREMSDFQMRLDNVPTANEFNDSFGSLDWGYVRKYVQSIPDYDSTPFENIDGLVLNSTSNIPSTDFQLPPPPRFSMVNIPFVYKFRGNPYATKSSSGESTVKGTYLKNYQQLVHGFDDTIQIPVEAHPALLEDYRKAQDTGVYPGSSKESKFKERLDQCLDILDRAFSVRPIWVKRHLDGIVSQELHGTLKIALSLRSYRFTKGPWRNTYIKFGVDPRTSSEYAKFQTEYFKVESKLQKSPLAAKNMPEPPAKFYKSDTQDGIDSRFYFDGQQIPWYLMLQIELLVHEPNIAEVCSKAVFLSKPTELTGWYHELDLTKIRKIVKYELGCLVQGNSEFSEYKLKFFKNLLYTKESMMTKDNAGIDADGDIQMSTSDGASGVSGDTANNPTKEIEGQEENGEEDGEDDDNGVEAGEMDDAVLEQEEDDADDADFGGFEGDNSQDRKPTTSNGEEQSSLDPDFDITNASFNDIITRVHQTDPDMATKLRKELDGLIFESELSHPR